MLRSSPFHPRIYYLYPQLVAAPQAREALLAHCARMGFDHVLVPHAFSTDAGMRERGLAELAGMCEANRLKLLVDIDVGALGTEPALLATHPEWFADSDGADDLPDPRKAPRRQHGNVIRFDRTEAAEAVLHYWTRRLRTCIEAGVTGFRCVGLGAPPAEFWKRLIDDVKTGGMEARFLAWTPGCTAEQVEALACCGFDATFSSGAWWDFRSRWLVDEHARLLRVAPPIAFPDSPFEAVIVRAAGSDDAHARQQAFRRALWLAASMGNGMLVPMGFEYGLSGLPDAVAHGGFEDARARALFDLTEEIQRANAFIAENGAAHYADCLRLLSGTQCGAAVLLRSPLAESDKTDKALLVFANGDAERPATVEPKHWLERAHGFVPLQRILPHGDAHARDEALTLAPGELQLFAAEKLPAIVVPTERTPEATLAATRAPRIAIENVTPTVDNGRFVVKRNVGELVNVEADVFMDGHDKLAVVLLWRAADEREWHESRMHAQGNDRWTAALPLTRVGRYLFAIEAWRDAFATYRDELEKKSTAGLNVSLELDEGRLLVLSAEQHARAKGMTAVARTLAELARSLELAEDGGEAHRDAERIAALLSEPTAEAMRQADARPFAVRTEPLLRMDAERTAARFSSWYELFPRSQSGDAQRHGSFDDVIRRLPAIQEMGFDTLYFPPIHPIGRKNRKGRNNSLTPGPDDPGSPYAIGAEEGGHDAIHPQLGTIEDFRRLRDEAARHGLELALDFAIQCSPDHPWLREHPDWFDWRPDGSIRYAENPPKKYQDIVNVDFYAKGAIPDLWIALRDVVLYWVSEGVRVFRVDNPHTKTLPFWEWMIADVRSRHPDTIFLSEAFTRPKMMYRLAKLGFSQSYTYFTWRHTRQEFIDYMTELASPPVRDFFRPHFFVNTPDINPPFLQKSGRPGFLIRAALATTLSGLWGMYSGFELCEATPVPGKEEYLDSEKYEIRAWDWQRPGNIIEEITQLNRIRKENPALQSHLGIRFCDSSGDDILVFLKTVKPPEENNLVDDNLVLVAINLDPFHAHDTRIELPMWQIGLPDDGALDVTDLLGGGRSVWRGKHQHIRLDPFDRPYAIWRIRQQGA